MATITVNLTNVQKDINNLNGLEWAIYGDSFSNNLTNDYVKNVADNTGLNPTTYAVAGDRFSQQLTILEAQIAGDPNYLQSYDLASIHLGVNDFPANTVLGDINSLTTDLNVAGYCKKMIELILTSNPSIKLFLITPPEADTVTIPYQGTNAEGWTLAELSDLLNQICSSYGVQCIDLFSLATFNLQTMGTYTDDNLHPNVEGRDLLGVIVASAFRQENSKGSRIVNTNIGNTNQVLTDDERTITLNGDTSTQVLSVKDSNTTDIFKIGGDGTLSLGNGMLNSSNVVQIHSSGFTKGINVVGSGTYGISSAGSHSIGGLLETSLASGTGAYGKANATTGINYGLRGEAIGVGTGTRVALRVEASGGVTDNIAIDVRAGSIKLNQSTQNITLNGNTSADTCNFTDSSGTNILTLYGDSTVRSNANWGVGVASNSSRKFYIVQSLANGQALRVNTTSTTGNNFGAILESKGSGATSNYACRLTASGASTNIALDITAGSIRVPSGATGFTGTGAYTTLTIENGIITNAV